MLSGRPNKCNLTQAPDVASIPIAHSINAVDVVGLTGFPVRRFTIISWVLDAMTWTRIPVALRILDLAFQAAVIETLAAIDHIRSDGTLMILLARISVRRRRVETNKGDLWLMTS